MDAAADEAALLLAAGAEINTALENEGTEARDLITARHATALHFAARRQDAAAVAVLLASGATVNEEDADGCTALDWAEMAPTQELNSRLTGLIEAYGGKRGPCCMYRFTSGEVQPTEEKSGTLCTKAT